MPGTPFAGAAAVLRAGFAGAARALTHPRSAASHPDLLQLRLELETLAQPASDAGALLAAFSDLEERLAQLHEAAREAAAAHDAWYSRGSRGPDPAGAYAPGDLRAVHEARIELRRARQATTAFRDADDQRHP